MASMLRITLRDSRVLAHFLNRQFALEQPLSSARSHWSVLTKASWKIKGVGEILEIKEDGFGITHLGQVAEALVIDACGAVIAGAIEDEADTAS
jgi:hypothetical protein